MTTIITSNLHISHREFLIKNQISAEAVSDKHIYPTDEHMQLKYVNVGIKLLLYIELNSNVRAFPNKVLMKKP